LSSNIHRVIVVDDELEIRYLVRILLANVRTCHVVAEGENGRDALELVEELRPEIVILDINMPVVDGLAALTAIRRIAPATRVIFYSSLPDAEEQALALGAFRYLNKGSDPQLLVQAVREATLS
jgi:DNA-binding NarL/FixJ family response regulator